MLVLLASGEALIHEKSDKLSSERVMKVDCVYQSMEESHNFVILLK